MAAQTDGTSTPTTTRVSVDDFEKIARCTLPKHLYEYIASGTDDERALRENRQSFSRWYLRPRVLSPVGNLSSNTTLFDCQLAFPLFTSPAGVQALCDPDHGECATARACFRAGIVFGLSQHSTRTIEQVAEAAPETMKWYQAYILKDRTVTQGLVRRALKSGYRGIILTVDSVKFGHREADARNGFNSLPPPHRLVNYGACPNSKSSLESTYNSAKHDAWDQNSELMFEQDVSWSDAVWMKKLIGPSVPLIIKGIMTSEDAILALEAGADAIMVSNHGGRQLDACLAPIDVLPEVADVVAGRIPILLDGGIRRGTDVVKAIALGATAVGIGKPIFYALASGGEEALVEMLRLLRREIEAAMALCGCQRVQDITRNHITRHPASRL